MNVDEAMVAIDVLLVSAVVSVYPFEIYKYKIIIQINVVYSVFSY